MYRVTNLGKDSDKRVGRSGGWKGGGHMCENVCQNTYRGYSKGYLVHLARCRAGSGRALWATLSRNSDYSFILTSKKRTINPSKETLIKSTTVGKFHS